MEKKLGKNGYYIEKSGCDYVYKGEKLHSVISVVHRSGQQKYHIGIDDHCYVFYMELDGGESRSCGNTHIFEELLEALKLLPPPR